MTIISLLILSLLITLGGCAPRVENLPAAQLHVALGLRYLAKGALQRAKNHLLHAQQLAPQAAETLDAWAYFEETIGNKESAKKHYLAAIAQHPNTGAVYNNYGTFLCRHHQYRAAVDAFLQAAQIPSYPYTAQAYENAGIAARLMQNNSQAQLYFQQAIRYDKTLLKSIRQLKDNEPSR